MINNYFRRLPLSINRNQKHPDHHHARAERSLAHAALAVDEMVPEDAPPGAHSVNPIRWTNSAGVRMSIPSY